MAKPRVFVSSTYYDLKYIRDDLKKFIMNMGYDPRVFETGVIVIHHDKPVDQSCYQEIQDCHMFVLIIGGRYGSPASDSEMDNNSELDKMYRYYNSVTRQEYVTARDRDIPIYIFVEKNVLAEYDTYRENPNNKSIKYKHASVNVFRLLDYVQGQRRNNYMRPFDKFDDIESWLKEQWAGLLADKLSQTSPQVTLRDLALQISDLRHVIDELEERTQSIMRTVQPAEAQIIGNEQPFLPQGGVSWRGQESQISELEPFTNKPLAKYLLSRKEVYITPSMLYSALLESESLVDFLKKAGFMKRFIDDFLSSEKIKEKAEKDYQELVNEYVSEGEEERE